MKNEGKSQFITAGREEYENRSSEDRFSLSSRRRTCNGKKNGWKNLHPERGEVTSSKSPHLQIEKSGPIPKKKREGNKGERAILDNLEKAGRERNPPGIARATM